mmetsp:Transcript_53848/g.166867  ORF Transcript_53848/g.166867 Transcript_53848/m.166867 type:complete len:277 (-) Transcript_53848:33-863(-)
MRAESLQQRAPLTPANAQEALADWLRHARPGIRRAALEAISEVLGSQSVSASEPEGMHPAPALPAENGKKPLPRWLAKFTEKKTTRTTATTTTSSSTTSTSTTTATTTTARRRRRRRRRRRTPPPPKPRYQLVDITTDPPTKSNPAYIVLPLLGKCVINRDSSVESFPVRVAECKDIEEQQWYFDGRRIRSVKDGSCMDHDLSQGMLKLRDCTSGTNQHWQLTVKGKLRSLTEQRRGMCAQASMAQKIIGDLVMKQCKDAGNQVFRFRRPRRVSKR